MTFPKINSDLFVMAYATYVAALADASLQDNQQDAPLFAFLQKTLELMEAGLDYQVLTNIFERKVKSLTNPMTKDTLIKIEADPKIESRFGFQKYLVKT